MNVWGAALKWCSRSGSDVYPDSMVPGGMVLLRCNTDDHGIAPIGGMAAPAGQLEMNHLAFEVAHRTFKPPFSPYATALPAREAVNRAVFGEDPPSRKFFDRCVDL